MIKVSSMGESSETEKQIEDGFIDLFTKLLPSERPTAVFLAFGDGRTLYYRLLPKGGMIKWKKAR